MRAHACDPFDPRCTPKAVRRWFSHPFAAQSAKRSCRRPASCGSDAGLKGPQRPHRHEDPWSKTRRIPETMVCLLCWAPSFLHPKSYPEHRVPSPYVVVYLAQSFHLSRAGLVGAERSVLVRSNPWCLDRRKLFMAIVLLDAQVAGCVFRLQLT